MQNSGLFERHFLHRLNRLPPFQVWVAPQRTQTAAGCIDQHTVNLASQALDAVITLVGNRRWVHIGQATASQPGFERIEPVRRGVKGIEPPGAAHGRAQGQGFAPGASTKINHHFATLGVHQLREQL